MLSEGVKAHALFWYNSPESSDFNTPFLEASEFDEKSGSQSEVKDKAILKNKNLYLDKSKNDNTSLWIHNIL